MPQLKAQSWSESTKAVLLALIVSVIAPLVLSISTNRSAQQTKEIDWARQDIVAERASKAVGEVAAAAKVTNDQLKVIHTLVNSNMTAALQSEYDALIVQRALMQEVIDLKRVAGKPPTSVALNALATTEAKIKELGARMEDRKKGTP